MAFIELTKARGKTLAFSISPAQGCGLTDSRHSHKVRALCSLQLHTAGKGADSRTVACGVKGTSPGISSSLPLQSPDRHHRLNLSPQTMVSIRRLKRQGGTDPGACSLN